MSEKNALITIPIDEKTVIVEKKYDRKINCSKPLPGMSGLCETKETIENGSILVTTHIDNLDKVIKALE